MKNSETPPIDVIIIAVPETAGSALYGMVDVLLAAGNIWQTLVRANHVDNLFRVRILSETGEPFVCGNGIPVNPELSVEQNPQAQIVILPELWLGPDEHLMGRFPELMDWIRRQHETGASIYSACSGSVMLAETGLLNDCEATSHWGNVSLGLSGPVSKVLSKSSISAGAKPGICRYGGTSCYRWWNNVLA
jgi:transcriptional regulator GlxA family with amidase domain